MLAAAAEARNRHEAVEVSRGGGGRVVVDRVPAAEQAGHHGLGDAGREAGGDGGVRRGPALFERFDPGDDGRRVPSCDRREHRGRIVTIPACSRHTRVAISSLRSQWGGGWWPPGRFGGQSVAPSGSPKCCCPSARPQSRPFAGASSRRAWTAESCKKEAV